MALYGKKLHIRKNGVVTDINLWTEIAEAGTPALHIRDGVNLVHAQLGAVTDGLASDLRVRKDNVVYAVLKNRWVMITIVQSANQTITVNVDGVPHTESFAVPYGTAFTADVTAAAGFSPGAISAASGVAEGDVTISATPATQSLASGSASGSGLYDLMVPTGVTVVKFDCSGSGWRTYWVGVSSGNAYQFCNILYNPGDEEMTLIRVWRKGTNRYLYLVDEVAGSGNVYNEEYNPFILSWSPEINAHGPTDGSLA